MKMGLPRLLLIALALVAVVVFFVEINSTRNDATRIAQVCVLGFAVLGVIGWRTSKNRS